LRRTLQPQIIDEHFQIIKFTNFQIMTLEILTPEKKLFSGEVYGVQLPGIAGLFEVLDKHAPLVSALGKGTLKVLRDRNNFSLFAIQSGFVEVLNNKTTVLVEGGEEL
jgi:F-type H+-transporting ATPase subunit epsilon